MVKKKACIFISGAGTNLKALIKNSREYNFPINITCVVSSTKTAKGLSTVARAPGKLFGLGDVLLGYLDYTNNKPMMSKAKAYQNMLQAMSFNLYKGGDRQNLEEIKEKFLANGGDGKIFDQVIELNKSNSDMKKYIENTKERYQTLSTTGLETDKKKI